MKRHRIRCCACLLLWVVMAYASGGVPGVGPWAWVHASEAEVVFPNARFERLEAFEANRLTAADRLFAQKNYEAAYEAYNAFLLEFERSDALPYALLRKARALHESRRRNEAIREYREVIDYFPDDVAFAAPAAFYIGQCHWQNGDRAQALTAWATMVRDPEYVKHPLAAIALNHLGEAMEAQENHERAAEYARQVAVHFRRENPEAAARAAETVVRHYVRRAMDEEGLRAFYEAYGGFGRHPAEITDAHETEAYWDRVRRWVEEHGRFEEGEADLRARYYGYWADVLERHLTEHDGTQLAAATFRRHADGDAARWAHQVDALFARGYEDGDWNRVIRWIGVHLEHGAPGGVRPYYEMLDFAAMSNDQIRPLMQRLDAHQDTRALARDAFGRMRLGEMDDDALERLAREVRSHGEAYVLRIAEATGDPARGLWIRLEYYHRERDADKGVPVADALAETPAYASRAIWRKAELLQGAGRYEEAIAAYRLMDNAPTNSWRIAVCYEGLGRTEEAVRVLREIENFFEDQAARAAREIAMVYRRARMEEEHIAQLRRILHRYPRTPEASFAHNELEQRGHRIGGGVDAD